MGDDAELQRLIEAESAAYRAVMADWQARERRFAARVAEKQAVYGAAWEQVFRLAMELDSPDVGPA